MKVGFVRPLYPSVHTHRIIRMKCDLKISSFYGGENDHVEGTIEVGGIIYFVEISGDASSRGARAIVNGEERQWSGSDSESSGGPPELEEAIEWIMDDCLAQVGARGPQTLLDEDGEVVTVDEEDNWVAKYVDGKVVDVEWKLEDDDAS